MNRAALTWSVVLVVAAFATALAWGPQPLSVALMAAAKRATQASSLPLCRDCERPLRPQHTRADDWPGTTVRWSADQCQTCAMREKRRGKVE